LTCQWWTRTWPEGPRPEPWKLLSEESSLKVREVLDQYTMTTVPEKSWKEEQCKVKMQQWIETMDEANFKKGSVIEVFEYVFCLLMISGQPGVGDKSSWWTTAIDNTTDWLESLACVPSLDRYKPL
jgi:hypothetical protein